MIIDECPVGLQSHGEMESLHSQLGKAKFKPNIIFLSYQPSNPDLYVDQNDWGLGHRLWRTLNAVVMLTRPMRKAQLSFHASDCALKR
jgi:hypothetical protein